jgi:hypothetical protein
MACSAPSAYVLNIHHPDCHALDPLEQDPSVTGDVIGTDGPGRTILAVTVDNWLIDELAAFDSDPEDREQDAEP